MAATVARSFACLTLLAALAAPAAAYNVFTYGNNEALKWGPSNTVGTPGGIVTWSLMPDGTALDPVNTQGLGMSGTSDLASVFTQVGGAAAALAALQQGFDAWESVANVQFVQVGEAGALAFAADPGGPAVVGHIRVGAFAIAGFAGAVGFAPPPNGGTTLEGDIIFNVANRFGLPAGNEGDAYALYPPPSGFYLNDFAGLFTHELGHALGLAHSDVPSAVMCGYVGSAFDGSACAWADPDQNGMAPITRIPKPDDVAGIQYLYGAAPVPEPGSALLLGAGAAVLLALRRRRSAFSAAASSTPSVP